MVVFLRVLLLWIAFVLLCTTLLSAQSVSVSTDKKTYTAGEVIYVTVKNNGTDSINYPKCDGSVTSGVFKVFDRHEQQVHIQDISKLGACRAEEFQPDDSLLFAWTQENYADGIYRQSLKPGTYQIRSIDSNGREQGRAHFTVIQSQTGSVAVTTGSKTYKKGERVEIIAANKGTKDIEYAGCNLDIEITSPSGRLLRLNKPGATCSSQPKTLKKGETETIGYWAQDYYDDNGNLLYAANGNYKVSFSGSTYEFSILQETLAGAKVLLRTDKQEYRQGETVQFYATNTGTVGITYSVCGANSLRITGPDGSVLTTDSPYSTCSATSTLLPAKTALVGRWNLVHYICSGGSCVNASAPTGTYKAELEGTSVEFSVVAAQSGAAKIETPPSPPSYDNPFVFTVELRKGWNMISIPAKSGLTLLDSTCSPLVFWNYSNSRYGIVQLSQLKQGHGYFALNTAEKCSMTFFSNGEYLRSEYSVGLGAGWNIIGSASGTILASEFKGCAFATPLFLLAADGTYQQVSYVEPGKAYWVKAKTACVLTV